MYIFTQILDKQQEELAQDYTYPASDRNRHVAKEA